MRGLILWFCLACAWPAAAVEAIPAAAQRLRSTVIRVARAEWGLDAPTAVFAAQIHQESRYRSDARSPVGAIGLAQFMPSTAAWLAGAYPDLGAPEPISPAWAVRALVVYDRHLWERLDGATACERMAFTLSAYNGGLGWVYRDRQLAARQGLDRRRWFAAVEQVNAGRSAAAWRENRGYPRRILRTLAPLYTAAGWGDSVCP